MRLALLLLLAAALVCAQDSFTPLFNGRDFDGWDIDTESAWSIRDGVVIGKTPGLKYNEFLRTKKHYSDFVLKLSMRIVGGKGNDYIVDGAGNDHMWGGKGADTFKVEVGGGSFDMIHDFRGKDTVMLADNLVIYSMEVSGGVTKMTLKDKDADMLDPAAGVLAVRGSFDESDIDWYAAPVVDEALL